MILAGVSDQHGKLSITAPKCDVLAVVGDIVPLLSSAENWKQFQELHWLETKYVRWIRRQEFEHCIVTFGNHDICAYAPDTRKLVREVLEEVPGVIVLDDVNSTVVIDDIRFSAYPFTPTIQQRNWAFSLPRGDRRVKMSLDACIHPETDVLLSHGPPQGFLDIGYGVGRCGCAELASKIVEVAPRIVLCGHIHESRGERDKMWNSKGRQTKLINVSICDRNYSEKGGKVATCEIHPLPEVWKSS